jgi:hypothetical protein
MNERESERPRIQGGGGSRRAQMQKGVGMRTIQKLMGSQTHLDHGSLL